MYIYIHVYIYIYINNVFYMIHEIKLAGLISPLKHLSKENLVHSLVSVRLS